MVGEATLNAVELFVALREITFGVVLFTLLVQGTTTELVVRWTGAGADSP